MAVSTNKKLKDPCFSNLRGLTVPFVLIRWLEQLRTAALYLNSSTCHMGHRNALDFGGETAGIS